MSNALALDKFGRITAFTGGNRGELLMIQNEGELPAEFLSRITSSGLIKENLPSFMQYSKSSFLWNVQSS